MPGNATNRVGWRRRITPWRVVGAVAGVLLAGGMVVIIASNHTRAILGGVWPAGTLLAGFACVGFLPLAAIAIEPGGTHRRTALCILIGHLLLAAWVGLTIYMVVPAHVILGMDQTRGIMDSLWQLHGEELAYAEQYRVKDPSAFARARAQVQADNLLFLRQWGRWTAETLLLTVAALMWNAHRRKLPGEVHATHEAGRGDSEDRSPERG